MNRNLFESLSVTPRRLLETNRLVRELMSNTLSTGGIRKVSKAGMLRSPETMTSGLNRGTEALEKKHNITRLKPGSGGAVDDSISQAPLGFGFRRSSAVDAANKVGGPRKDRKLARKLLKHMGGSSGATFVPGNAPLIQRHEADEIRSKAKHYGNIAKGNNLVGRHHGIDVLGREVQNAARLRVHGATTNEGAIGDLEKARAGTGEYAMTRRIAKPNREIKSFEMKNTGGNVSAGYRQDNKKSSWVSKEQMQRLRKAEPDKFTQDLKMPVFQTRLPRPQRNPKMDRKKAKDMGRERRAHPEYFASKAPNKEDYEPGKRKLLPMLRKRAGTAASRIDKSTKESNSISSNLLESLRNNNVWSITESSRRPHGALRG